MKKRGYTKRKRAEKEAQTRQRIVEAAADLHEELGPRETSISAVAERAGVQRLTVYRHFPDDYALFQACTSHWLEQNPLPDRRAWSEGRSTGEKTRMALLSLYRYYRRTAPMWSSAYRGAELVPALDQPMSEVQQYLDGMRDDLLSGWNAEGAARRRVRATLGHLLEFSTWRSLKEQGLRDPEMSRMGLGWVEAAANPKKGRARGG